jgi:hypothetical protein
MATKTLAPALFLASADKTSIDNHVAGAVFRPSFVAR